MREERRGKWSFYTLDREAASGLLGEAADRLLSGVEKRSVVGELLMRQEAPRAPHGSSPPAPRAPGRWSRGWRDGPGGGEAREGPSPRRSSSPAQPRGP